MNYLSQHQSTVEGTVLTGGRIVVELLAGVVLCFFVSFFLIKDGDADLVLADQRARSRERRRRANLAGRRRLAGRRLLRQGHGRGGRDPRRGDGRSRSTIIGSPLVAPLALFMFVAAFVPLVGVLIAGTVAHPDRARDQGLDRRGHRARASWS